MSDVEFEPVVVILGSAIVALRPRDGTIVWSVPTDQPVVRIYRFHERMFAVSGTRVICLDLQTGEVIGQVDVGFAPESGMVCDQQLVLLRGGQPGASPEAIVSLGTDGRVRWRGTLVLDGKKAKFATFDASGKSKSKATFLFTDAPAGIAYRDAVVQPDLNR